MQISIQEILRDALSFFYPELCAACNDLMIKGEDVICTRCRISLPYTNYHKDSENPVAKQFWGKVKVDHAMAFLHFNKGEKVQQLIHRLKYDNRPDVGVCIGKLFGLHVQSSPAFNTVDFIIPIPLHKKKEKLRGYNQAACFADGIMLATGVPSLEHGMKRVKHTDTQTRKNRFARHKNVLEVFKVSDADKLKGKHILLVDDVITTGSTLSACTTVLQSIDDVRVSIAAIAFAEL